MTAFSPRLEHVVLHRLWLFAKLQSTLGVLEHAHINDCEDCRVALRACLNAETFGAVLLQLGTADEGGTESIQDN